MEYRHETHLPEWINSVPEHACGHHMAYSHVDTSGFVHWVCGHCEARQTVHKTTYPGYDPAVQIDEKHD